MRSGGRGQKVRGPLLAPRLRRGWETMAGQTACTALEPRGRGHVRPAQGPKKCPCMASYLVSSGPQTPSYLLLCVTYVTILTPSSAPGPRTCHTITGAGAQKMPPKTDCSLYWWVLRLYPFISVSVSAMCPHPPMSPIVPINLASGAF